MQSTRRQLPGLAAIVTAFLALAFTAPYLIVQLTLWLLFRTRTK